MIEVAAGLTPALAPGPAGGAGALIEADRLLVLAAFAAATLWTPGPNNILLATSGAQFGLRRTVPHALGVALGFPMMMFGVALGLGEVFRASPEIGEALRWIGAALLLYIGWRVATAAPTSAAETEDPAIAASGALRPWRFEEAAAFQWINPKAWSMAIGVAANYVTGAAPMAEAAICAGVFAALGVGSAFAWTGFGAAIRRFLSTESRRRAFNWTMGALVAVCALILLFDA